MFATDSEKLVFAERLLRRQDNAFAAASDMFPIDLGKRNWIATMLPFDPIVKVERQRLLEKNGLAYYLPTKDELGQEIYKMIAIETNSDRKLDIYRLYATVMGYVGKNGVNDSRPIPIELSFADKTL